MSKTIEPNPGGRPTKMTPETLEKLKDGFLMGFSDEEACAYAEISKTTLYNYQEDHKEFVDQKEEWKGNPILKAKTTIFKRLHDVETAKWYLERKKKDEFSSRNEFTGADGEKLESLVVIKHGEGNTSK